VEVVARVFFVGLVRLIRPIDADFLYKSPRLSEFLLVSPCVGRQDTYRLVNPSSVQGLHRALSCAGVIVLDKTVVVTLGLLEM
jgi:hypothetical protein